MFGMSNEVRALPFPGLAARMFEIVKRQHIRQAGPLGPANQRRPAAVVPDMLGKQNMSFGEIQKDRSFFDDPVRCRADMDRESNQVL